MLALYCPFGVQGSSSSQLDKYRHWHDHQCSLVTPKLQTNHVIESKNTSFTVTHLVWNKRSAQQDRKMGKNDSTFTMSTVIPTHQREKVRQRPSLVCSSFRVFSRCSSIFPGVILALLLASFFNYVHCKLDLLLTLVSRSDIGERGDWPGSVGEDRQNRAERRSWNCGAPSASA